MFSIKEGEIVPSFGIGEVVASQTKEFAVGDIVWGGLSWSRFHYSKITTESEPQKQMLKIEKVHIFLKPFD
jgi:NADPH-dependent curcumin reductase CurA